MSSLQTKYEDVLTNAELEIEQVRSQLAKIYNAINGMTDSGVQIGVRAAIRGIAYELEQAQSEFKYLRDTLIFNKTTITEVIKKAQEDSK